MKSFKFDPKARRLGHGIYSLEDIRQRCVIDKESGCWRWGMSMNRAGNGAIVPRVSVPAGVLCAHRVPSMAGGKAAWLMSGRRLEDGCIVWRTCGCNSCVNPAHLKAGTKKQEGAFMAAAGVYSSVQRRINSTKNVLKSQALPADVVQDVERELVGGALQREIAERHKISIATISAIKNGRHIRQRIAASFVRGV